MAIAMDRIQQTEAGTLPASRMGLTSSILEKAFNFYAYYRLLQLQSRVKLNARRVFLIIIAFDKLGRTPLLDIVEQLRDQDLPLPDTAICRNGSNKNTLI